MPNFATRLDRQLTQPLRADFPSSDTRQNSFYCPVTVRQIPNTADDSKHVSAGQRLFTIKCQLVPLSVATKETKKAA